MKLLVFCHEYPPVGGGASNGLYHLAAAWISQGHQVTVVTSAFGAEPADSVREGIRVIRIAAGRRSADRGRIREMLAYLLNASLQVCRWRRFGPDRTLAFLTIPAGPPAFLMKIFYGIPYIVELRGGDVPGFDPRHLGTFHAWTRLWIRLIWKHASWIIANSEGLKKLAVAEDPSLRVRVLPNGVDVEAFPCAASRPDCPVRILYAGRLSDSQKRVSELIEALPAVNASGASVELMVVGDGADRAQLERLSLRLNVRDQVRFEGWLSKTELKKRYQAASIFVSMSRWEGMPNSVLEAMASGLPVVLSRIPGHEELVSEAESGFLVGAGAIGELSAALIRLAGDPVLRNRMGRASRLRAETRHSWADLARKHLEPFVQES